MAWRRALMAGAMTGMLAGPSARALPHRDASWKQPTPIVERFCRARANEYAYCRGPWQLAVLADRVRIRVRHRSSAPVEATEAEYRFSRKEVGAPVAAHATETTLYFLTAKGWVYAMRHPLEDALRAQQIFEPMAPAHARLQAARDDYDVEIVGEGHRVGVRYLGSGDFRFSPASAQY